MAWLSQLASYLKGRPPRLSPGPGTLPSLSEAIGTLPMVVGRVLRSYLRTTKRVHKAWGLTGGFSPDE